YSKWIGLAAALAIIAVCYLPWVYVPQVPLEIGGMYASAKHNFGKPGLMNCILSVVAMFMFLLPFIWAKRTNIFICAFNIAWAIRDYFLLSRCYGGECPEKKLGLYLLVVFSLIMLVMSFLPDIEIKEKKS
ncbi:MAG: hypothetical protein JST39_10010, partial [Bacteroidetes bacterium]|nr:hypothetical protein [Bacteroidota bacterium]